MKHIGLRKKLEKSAKQKGFELIGEWTKSIMNRLYWCVPSTDIGDDDTVLAKWLSLNHHIHNIHEHDHDTFPRCLHEDKIMRKWFEQGAVHNTCQHTSCTL